MAATQEPNAPLFALSSPRWRELSQAYGSAEDIPQLLEALASTRQPLERAEIWFGIWATLCPDGHVFSAAYAAVPHLLRITQPDALEERVAAMHIAVSVEIARQDPGAPPIPDDVVASYASAIESLPARVAELSVVAWDATSAQILAAALLVGTRQPALARAVLQIASAP